METTFRQAKPELPPVVEAPVKETQNILGKEDVAISGTPVAHSDLEDWETQNGKYGLEWLGLKEIGKQFPYNANFSEVDKFIKGELEERGYDKTRERYQEILHEIEQQIGSQKLRAIDRLQRIKNYIQVLKKMKSLKQQKQAYESFHAGLVQN